MESILVLEDEENFRILLSETLRDAGYEVTEAASAEEAIAFARRTSFHLILTDVRMAGVLDGVGAVEQIKSFRPHIRSIVLTGYTDQNVPLRAAEVQADDYLFKPVQGSQLLEVVRLTLDRQFADLDLLDQILQIPGDLVQKALSWIYDGKVQQLGQLRERCFQRLFVLLRANRLSPEDAYPVYLQLLDVESRYHQAKPGDWDKLLTAYGAVENSVLAATAQESLARPADHNLSWEKFQRLCQRLKDGEISAAQFQQSALLFLEPSLRRANLASYLIYQKLWAANAPASPQATDPLLGKTFGGFTLRRLLPEYTEVRVYSALNDSKMSRLVMAFSPEANAQNLIQDDLQDGKATPLGQHHGFELILLNQQDHPLRQQIPPGGLPPSSAWKLMRSVFQQVQKYHEQGICSGSITLDDIEVIPGPSARLTRFSPEYALGVIRKAVEIRDSGLFTPGRIIGKVPLEIASGRVDKPMPASDQAMLAYNFSRILVGLDLPFSTLVFFCIPSDQVIDKHPAWKHLHQICSPELYAILCRMSDPEPTQRYPNLSEAISAIDRVLTHSQVET